ncbi:iron-sulfur cluster repair di-iron protein [Marinoscillum sp. 108]|uniref:iron-sulfur cluster repair di-iron protein n=1 Tax=Marinoscillum sp. 108 TaxID=2653151 RepID=UPI0012F38C17|nr:iron-sulfur cluster repair di-iron protein [Marinoscillum sp. 108]VXD18281.1 Iron-sulfur cluster repair di-iron protein [Marinoscillum sp. 108]
MKNLAKSKVGVIVASNFRTSRVFSSHHIDFCCSGGISLEEACTRNNVDLDRVLEELEATFQTPDTMNYQELDLDKLIDTIVSMHHSYVWATVPALRAYLEKLCTVHGDRHPELHSVNDLFAKGSQALLDHMTKEEQILFPYIKAMVQAKAKEFPLSKPHFGDIENPIQMMEQEHEEEGFRFRQIAELTGGYECPPDGCQTYKVAYAMLKEFEEDLHKHIHLENNILFPEARKLFREFSFSNS